MLNDIALQYYIMIQLKNIHKTSIKTISKHSAQRRQQAKLQIIFFV